MALGDLYVSLTEMKDRLGITDTSDDSDITSALTAASRGIDVVCGREFNKTDTASARLFWADGHRLAKVHDFHSLTDFELATDSSGDGTYATTWSAADYQLEPVNGIVSGFSGWPYFRIRAVGSTSFPFGTERASVRVTARWGWSSVPGPVKEACFVVASEVFKLKEAPFGVAGMGQWGSIRVRENPIALNMLAPYRRTAVRVA